MSRRARQFAGLLMLFACSAPELPAAKRPFTFYEMMKVKRVADPQISPDGKRLAYSVTTYNLENNSKNRVPTFPLASVLFLVNAHG